MLKHALNYAARGWRVFPCKPRGKTPRTKHGHNDATTDAGKIRDWWSACPDANIGLATGDGLAVVDVDNPDGLYELEAKHGDLPDTLGAVTGSGGAHLFFRYDGDELRSKNGFGRGVDLKADGGYVIAPPSVHPSGGVYAWDTADDLPSEVITPLPAWIRAHRQVSPKPQSTAAAGQADLTRVVEALKHIPSDDRETWLKVGMAIHHETGGNEEGFSLWRLWSMGSEKFDEKDQIKVWNSFGRGAKHKTIAAVFAIAKEHGYRVQKPQAQAESLPTFDVGDEQEVANYLLGVIESKGRTVADLGALWRYDSSRGLWGDIADDKGRQMVGNLWGAQVVRGVDENGEVETKHWRVGKNTRANVWAIVCDDRRRDQFFDRAPSALVFEDCVMLIDEGGELRSEAHHHSFRARIGYPFKFSRGGCSRWLEALDQWFDGDEDRETKIQFIREFAGACLFGLAPRYQRAVILYGKGGNGKSTCLDAIERMFPPEAVQCVSPQSMTGHSSEYYLAQLRDARLNVVRDMPSTSLLQSADFKAAVSGEPLMARPIGQDPFSFSPKAGHIFGANALPSTTDHSTGFWRRWVVVPFLRRFEVAKGTENLADAIARDELPGMVAWAIEGAAALTMRGHYVLPESHKDAVDAWASNVNPVKAWLEDTCSQGEDKWTKATTLYQSHREWCQQNGVHPVSSRKFGERMDSLGVGRAVRQGARGFRVVQMAIN